MLKPWEVKVVWTRGTDKRLVLAWYNSKLLTVVEVERWLSSGEQRVSNILRETTMLTPVLHLHNDVTAEWSATGTENHLLQTIEPVN